MSCVHGPSPAGGMRSALAVVDDCESLSATDGLVLDLQPRSSFDQLAEPAVLGRVVRIDGVRIDAEQQTADGPYRERGVRPRWPHAAEQPDRHGGRSFGAPHLDRVGGRGALPRRGVPIAHHQPPPVLIPRAPSLHQGS